MRRGERTTVYKIRDTEGRLIAEKHRFNKPSGGKDMFWKLPGMEPNEWGLNGTPVEDLPLYGSERVSEYHLDELIVIAEGEKVRDALEAADIPAVGTVTGAGKTPGAEALEVLRDRRVCLWPDGDDIGRKHMERIAERLHDVALETLLYTWHDAPEGVKGLDAADHPAVQSKDPEALDRLLQNLEDAPRWKPTDPPAKAEPKTFSAVELMAMELPDVRWAVPGLIPEGVTFLAGKPKMGKSWMALGLCLAVSTGGVALGKEQVERGEVLYLALEDNVRRLRKRLGKLLVGREAPAALHVQTDWPRLNERGAEALEEWLTSHPDTRLVVVDTLARVKPRAAGRRSAYDEDRDAVDPLIPIAARHSVAIILVHHLREAESEDPLDMITGTAGLTGGADGALVLKRKRGKADAYLQIDGRDIENPTELALKFEQDTATWTILGDAEEYRMSEGRRIISGIIKDADEALNPQEITEILNEKGVDMKYGNVRQMLSQMVKDGQAKNLGRGKYVHPDNLQEQPDNADNLTNGKGNVSLSGMSAHPRTDGAQEKPWPHHEVGCRCEDCSSRWPRGEKGDVA